MPSRPQQRPAPQDPKAELAKQARLWGLAVICAAAGAGTVAATGTLLPGIGVFLITLLVLGPLLWLLEKRIREKPGPK